MSYPSFVVTQLREDILEGIAIELIPNPAGGYYALVGMRDEPIYGRTAAEVFLNIADIMAMDVEGTKVQ